MAPLPALAALLPGIPLTPPPPLPETAPPPALTRRIPQPAQHPAAGRQEGDVVSLNGQRQQARWLLDNGELWLPLEVLEGQLGVSRSSDSRRGIQLEWFGQKLQVPPAQQRSLDDEVAVPVNALLTPLGVSSSVRGKLLELTLPARPLQAIRWRDQGISGRRVVLDLHGPAMLRSGDNQLQLSIETSAGQLSELEGLGLSPRRQGDWLSLKAGDARLLTLAGPWRLVLDLPPGPESRSAQQNNDNLANAAERDPRLLALRAQGLELQRRTARIGNRAVLIQGVKLDPRQVPLELRPLNRADGMQGLSSLSQLARQEQALIAINGGYFNRVNRLPLGAMREQGRWLSGPILNRGAMGWEAGQLPSFDRLRLDESLEDGSGRRWPVLSVNSGYVQKGLARYTADWGRRYQPITGSESGVLIRGGRVSQTLEPAVMQAGVALQPGDLLIVARGGAAAPWQPGEALSLRSRASSAVGDKSHVLGGGPLLLAGGRVVLNGSAEGFSAGFLQQGAPRTVVASDGRQLWLLTLQGVGNAGPTLMETAVLLRQEGLQDALNLDGGSSTGLVLADVHTVKGRGVAAAVHNGLGLVPRGRGTSLATGAP